ncbi:hypothetical protein [Acidisphaera rubrifaciens]|uniref:HPP family protein n=1 Tax=Acidisphaera rubrifaciens HS-AP3 TaxID=1231350 RepID=A0A0D6PC94_9PROT|nr:hypothetical protein [Acidisphaera rubrifaciens]GAN78479.1 hypothetical protein Asru_0920_01 [Acidisphaera rubrifaciens HS-AP3]
MLPRQQTASTGRPPPRAPFARTAWPGEVATVAYIALVAGIAQAMHLPYVLFPELGALSHDILKRPHGTWARAPVMLVVTPLLTGLVGTLVTRHLNYGIVSVLLTVGAAIAIIAVLRSPIAPAISAGLLPLTLGIGSPLYAPSLLIGLGALAAISTIWRRFVPPPPDAGSPGDLADDITEEAPEDYSWIAFVVAFLVIATALAEATGRHLLLFPPLVVIAFEMFAHARVCPWAGRPLILPVACTLTAAAGVALVSMFGAVPLAAAASMLVGIGILRAFDLHVPPALAVGLLPFVIPGVDYGFAIAVGAGTLLLTLFFLGWRRIASVAP